MRGCKGAFDPLARASVPLEVRGEPAVAPSRRRTYNRVVAVGTAFHERTFALCESLSYREWSGYYAVSAYETHHEHEYNAIRNAAALIDISPLFKYRVSGPDATRLVDRVITRDTRQMSVGQVWYTPWCDEHGKVIDDGTVARLDEQTYRGPQRIPACDGFGRTPPACGLRSRMCRIGSRRSRCRDRRPRERWRAAAQANIDSLRYFRVTSGHIGRVAVDISRTGYTGDLGYEIWVPAESAIEVWDTLMHEGRPFDIKPAGMLALDVARVEAGLLLIDVDFNSSRKALIDAQKYTPFEMGLGRLVTSDKGPFVGRKALAEERRRGPSRMVVGLELDWTDVEALYERFALAPVAPATASRVHVPVMRNGQQVGRATTTAWSPTLKRLLALATIDAPFFTEGTRLEVEVTVEAVRHYVGATVVKTPFFNPARKTATPPE